MLHANLRAKKMSKRIFEFNLPSKLRVEMETSSGRNAVAVGE
jgi:hypothetical protein